jgi:hypothetical protein
MGGGVGCLVTGGSVTLRKTGIMYTVTGDIFDRPMRKGKWDSLGKDFDYLFVGQLMSMIDDD